MAQMHVLLLAMNSRDKEKKRNNAVLSRLYLERLIAFTGDADFCLTLYLDQGTKTELDAANGLNTAQKSDQVERHGWNRASSDSVSASHDS